MLGTHADVSAFCFVEKTKPLPFSAFSAFSAVMLEVLIVAKCGLCGRESVTISGILRYCADCRGLRAATQRDVRVRLAPQDWKMSKSVTRTFYQEVTIERIPRQGNIER